MQQIFNRILNRTSSQNDEKKDISQPKENSSLQPNTIEIQNHLIYCLENSSINLLPAMARYGFSSIQNEKILLMKELIQHSKSFIEEPVKEPSQMNQTGIQDLMQIIQNRQSDDGDTNSEISQEINSDDDIEEEDQDLEEQYGDLEEYEDPLDEDYQSDEEIEDSENQEETQADQINQPQNINSNQNQQNENDEEDIQDEEQYQNYEGDDYD
ncbi:hypothetical protein ABPG74_002413 [Tetrahymena malaccensis]